MLLHYMHIKWQDMLEMPVIKIFQFYEYAVYFAGIESYLAVVGMS